MLFQINILPLCSCLTLGSPYGAYYLVVLLSASFLFVVAFTASWPSVSTGWLRGKRAGLGLSSIDRPKAIDQRMYLLHYVCDSVRLSLLSVNVGLSSANTVMIIKFAAAFLLISFLPYIEVGPSLQPARHLSC